MVPDHRRLRRGSGVVVQYKTIAYYMPDAKAPTRADGELINPKPKKITLMGPRGIIYPKPQISLPNLMKRK